MVPLPYVEGNQGLFHTRHETLFVRVRAHYADLADYSKIKRKVRQYCITFLIVKMFFNANSGVPVPVPHINGGPYAQQLKMSFRIE